MARTPFSGRAFDELNFSWYSCLVRSRVDGEFTKFYSVNVLETSVEAATMKVRNAISVDCSIQQTAYKGTISEWEEHYGIRVENPTREEQRVEDSKLI